jgi:hypothetical protein
VSWPGPAESDTFFLIYNENGRDLGKSRMCLVVAKVWPCSSVRLGFPYETCKLESIKLPSTNN